MNVTISASLTSSVIQNENEKSIVLGLVEIDQLVVQQIAVGSCLKALVHEVRLLRADNIALQQRVTELEYAPPLHGGTGYQAAAHAFETRRSSEPDTEKPDAHPGLD